MDKEDLLERTVVFNSVLGKLLRQIRRLRSEKMLGLLDLSGFIMAFDQDFWEDCSLTTRDEVEAFLRKFKVIQL